MGACTGNGTNLVEMEMYPLAMKISVKSMRKEKKFVKSQNFLLFWGWMVKTLNFLRITLYQHEPQFRLNR